MNSFVLLREVYTVMTQLVRRTLFPVDQLNVMQQFGVTRVTFV
jgi:hypothetical protein